MTQVGNESCMIVRHALYFMSCVAKSLLERQSPIDYAWDTNVLEFFYVFDSGFDHYYYRCQRYFCLQSLIYDFCILISHFEYFLAKIDIVTSC